MRHTSLLAIVTSLCAFATTAAALPPDLTTFREVRWETFKHATPGFELKYPYHFERDKPGGNGEVFSAHYLMRTPGLSVSVLARETDQTLQASAATALTRLATRFGATVRIENQRDLTLGGVPARIATGSWLAKLGGGLPLRTMVVSIYRGDRWIVVYATDGLNRAGLMKELEQAALSIRFTD